MDKEILYKFLSNQCSYKECESVAQFLNENEHELDRIDFFESFPESEIISITDTEKKAVFNALFPKHDYFLKYVLIAASILLVGLFSFFLLRTVDDVKVHPTQSWLNVINPYDEDRWYMLPDGSKIKMKPKSKIAYAKEFVSNREIKQTQGDVTYYVYSDKNHPFRVINKGIEIRALGTVFRIAKEDKNHLLVQLLEGKIVVKRHKDSNPNQIFINLSSTLLIHIDDLNYKVIDNKSPLASNSWEIEKTKINSYNSSIIWSNQVISFNGVLNLDLFSIMERLYDIRITVDRESIASGNFTGQLYKDDNLKEFLDVFCQINGCTFTIDNKSIRIK